MDAPDSTMEYEMDKVIMANVDYPTSIDEPAWITVLAAIVGVMWIAFCIVPNSIIVRRIGNSELYRTNNFYFVLVHLCWGNLLLMIYPMYLAFVTDEYQSDPKTFVFLLFHINTVQMHIQHAMFFTFDMFMNSKKFGRQNVKNSWTIHVLTILLITILIMHEVANMHYVLYGFIAISTIVLSVYIIRVIVYLVKGTDQANFTLRLAISGVCIVVNYGYVAWAVIENFYDINSLKIFKGITFVVLTNGWFILLLIKYNDPSVDVRIQLRKQCEELKMKVLKRCKKEADGGPLEATSTNQETTVTIEHPSGSVGIVSPAYISDLGRQKISDAFDPVIVGHRIGCCCNECIFENRASMSKPRNSKESNTNDI